MLFHDETPARTTDVAERWPIRLPTSAAIVPTFPTDVAAPSWAGSITLASSAATTPG